MLKLLCFRVTNPYLLLLLPGTCQRITLRNLLSVHNNLHYKHKLTKRKRLLPSVSQTHHLLVQKKDEEDIYHLLIEYVSGTVYEYMNNILDMDENISIIGHQLLIHPCLSH